MIREIAHFLREFPAARRLKAKMPAVDLLDLVEVRLDEAGKAAFRASLVADLEGDVLEIGAGTGLMFPHYSRAVRLTATEPDEEALCRAAVRAEHAEAQITLQLGEGESLPFPDASFDAVVCCSVLCCVQSVEQTLAEVRRVLKTGRQFRLMEHVKSDHLVAGMLMDLLNPIWLGMNGVGCNMNRDTERALRASGFTPVEVKRCQFFAKTFPFAFPYRWIKAVRI